MTMQSRSQLIGSIATELKCPVISYVTGDRQGLQTQVSNDQPPLFPRHLKALGDHEQMGMVLYTQGGDTNVPWSIISMLREHCERLTVLVPFCAHSSGTLTALGADEIVMTRYATLSPIDPTVANAFNPQDPTNPQSRYPIAVEDVLAFLELARENVDGVAYEAAFQQLASSVHPLALGNVKRSINQIRQLAKKLINLHPPAHEPDELNGLVTRLTTEFYSHQHLIGRREAKDIGLPVKWGNQALEDLLAAYYEELKVDLQLLEPFNPPALLKAALAQAGAQGIAPPQHVPVDCERAYIETTTTCDAFVSRGHVLQQTIPTPAGPQNAIAFEVDSERWEQLA